MYRVTGLSSDTWKDFGVLISSPLYGWESHNGAYLFNASYDQEDGNPPYPEPGLFHPPIENVLVVATRDPIHNFIVSPTGGFLTFQFLYPVSGDWTFECGWKCNGDHRGV